MHAGRKRLLIAVAIGAAVAGWYAFRPERLFVNRVVDEAPIASPDSVTELAMGRFHSNAHETAGIASVVQLADGRRVLRLSEFSTANGPDVHVYLVAAADVQDEATVKQAGFVTLGAMKGNRGDQNYDIPAGVDLSRYRTVTIWCRRFSVNFGSAPLVQS